MKKIIVVGLLLVAGCGGGGGGAETSPSIATPAVAPTVSVARLDVNGTWKQISNNCANPDNSDIFIIEGSTVDAIQHFTSADGNDGFLNIETGNFMICYEGTINVCALACIGTVNATYKASLICDDPAGGVCDVVVQKQ